jgi:hypothetical protein
MSEVQVQTVSHEARENVTHEEGPSPSFEPLFEDEGGFSEDQLTGDEVPQETVSEDQTSETKETSETPDPEGTPNETETKEATETKEPDNPETEKKEAKPEKPPEGYVEIQALHAERHKRRETEERFQREIDNLKAEIYASREKPKEEKSDDPWKDFKVLSDDEFNDLKEEDPDEAIVYLRKEQRYKEHQQQQEADRVASERARYQQDQLITRAWDKINEVIPNVLDRDRPEVQEAVNKLNEFAEGQGFTQAELVALSNPSTRVVVKDPQTGKDRVALLGETAANFVKVLDGYSKANSASLTAEKEAEIRRDEREKAIAEITAKIKKGETDFRSLGDAPTTSEKPGSKAGGVYTEAEWNKLSDEERRRALGG